MTDIASTTLPAELLQALVDQSRDLFVMTDAVGTLLWVNDTFASATGFIPGSAGATLLDFTPPGTGGTSTRLAFAGMLSNPGLEAADIEMRGANGRTLWVDARAKRLDRRLLWTLIDVTRTHELAAQARRQGELLDIAQEFGRLGVWERAIPSGEGHWDKHVFGFWALDPADGTPSYAQAIERIHPEDRARMTYAETTRRAGRYAQRYRVMQPDGKTRWIHSQWAVKNGALGTPDRAVGVMVDDTEAYDAARALSHVNAQLELAVELGKIVIWRHDLRTQRMYYSDRAYELLGLAPRPEGFSIEEVRAFIHPDDIPSVLASAEAALHSKEPLDMEARYRRIDGTWRYVLTRRVVERDERGTPLAFVGVALDMTERVEHLREADELARRLEAASRAAGVGIWTTSIAPPATDWNAQMFALFDRFEGPTAPTLGQWLRESVHVDDRERIDREARHLLHAGAGPFELEFRSLRRDGGVRWIVMRANVDPSQSEGRRIFGVAMDVTEQHIALAALRDASARVTLIARHAGIGMWEADLNATPERWDEQMFLLRGMTPRPSPPSREERMSLVHPDDVPLLLDSIAGTPAAAAPASYEFRFRLPDGQYRWLASRSAIVTDEDGRPKRRVGVNWDVTESKNAELARQQATLAQRAMEAKSQFLSRMSHELRTPLNAVLGFTQLLQLEAHAAKSPTQLAKLGHIRAAGEHLLSLINDVLDLSGLESGEVRLELQGVELARVVDESLPLLESLAAQRGVVVERGSVEGTALADRTRLRQVLINLLSNAIKYNRPGGRVRVAAEMRDGLAVLSVSDNGRGLSAEQIGSLFEPFNRFGVENEGIEGTGIGLTIVKALVDGMNGRIDVSSRPGLETIFRVSLPATTAPARAEPSNQRVDDSVAGAEAASQRRSGTVLYIEDNPVNVLLVEELVQSLGGLEIRSEATGVAGVARAQALQPDLVLIDLQLPDIDGFEVLRRLRADAATSGIPCIALSANALSDDIRRGLEAGFAAYWTKPIDFATFMTAMKARFPADLSALPALPELPALAEPPARPDVFSSAGSAAAAAPVAEKLAQRPGKRGRSR